jgi:hypothetical protein
MAQDRDVCSGGTVSKSESSFTFTNHHNQSCSVHFPTPPPGAASDYTVPAASGTPPTPGTQVVPYTSGITGDYSYSKPTCCGAAQTNPSIKVQ